MIYLDYNATTPMRPEAISALTHAATVVGNPSSVHAAGRAARHEMEAARRILATHLGATPGRITFTSGGSEANALAIAGWETVFYSAIEHDCVRAAVARYAPDGHALKVTPDGVVDLNALEEAFTNAPGPGLIAVMLANNETGVIQPIEDIVALADQYGFKVHCDAVQAIGKIPVSMDALGVHSMTVSAHKFGGPKGVGALLHHEPANLAAIMVGGGQERRKRAGTENLVGIVSMGAALEAAIADLAHMTEIETHRDHLQKHLTSAVPEAIVYGAGAPRLPNTLCVGVPGLKNETQLMQMDLAGVCVSSGAACSSGKVAPSHVLTAMGASDQAATETLRFSLGWLTTKEDMDRTAAAWVAMAQRHLGRAKAS